MACGNQLFTRTRSQRSQEKVIYQMIYIQQITKESERCSVMAFVPHDIILCFGDGWGGWCILVLQVAVGSTYAVYDI